MMVKSPCRRFDLVLTENAKTLFVEATDNTSRAPACTVSFSSRTIGNQSTREFCLDLKE